MPDRLTRRLPLTEANYCASVDGLKTHTRRVVVPQPHDDATFGISPIWGRGTGVPMSMEGKWKSQRAFIHARVGSTDRFICCPYGPPGTRLALEEPFRVVGTSTHMPHCDAAVEYKWHDSEIVQNVRIPESHWAKPTSQISPRFRSPRFMPLWAARRFSISTEVRVEQLQKISEEDVAREGIVRFPQGDQGNCGTCHPAWTIPGYAGYWHAEDARAAYAQVWDRINAARGHPWERNDWVWVIAYKMEGAPK